MEKKAIVLVGAWAFWLVNFCLLILLSLELVFKNNNKAVYNAEVALILSLGALGVITLIDLYDALKE